ncbi:amidohydrolase [Taibaiella chishuiensis]|nr:amidohydrolase [Taibaiella chishuiensis]
MNMKKMSLKKMVAVVALALSGACGALYAQGNYADVIFQGGSVIPMSNTDGARIMLADLAVRGDRIVYIGTDRKRLDLLKGPQTRTINCKDKTLMPGFIDAHAHIGLYAATRLMADLSGPPYGVDTSIAVLSNIMNRFRKDNYGNTPPAVLIGNNYDDAYLANNKQPTKEDLDGISKDFPVYVIHVSGHMGVANTAMLRLLGFNNSTPADVIEGGTVVKNADGTINGLLLENAHLLASDKAIGLLEQSMGKDALNKKMMQYLLEGEKLWFKNGITTICEGRTFPPLYDLIRTADSLKKLKADYILLPDFDAYYQVKNNVVNNNLGQFKALYNNYGNRRYKVGAVKLSFDGSPQGRDACLSYLYKNPPIGQDPATYKGRLEYQPAVAKRNVQAALAAGLPVHIHCNGDSAIGEALSIFKELKANNQLPQTATKNVIVHNQLLRQDQIAAYIDLKDQVMPSFFPIHTYIWGNWYLSTVLPRERALYICPLKDVYDKGIPFTLHTDSPITPPDLLMAVYSANTRKMYRPYGDMTVLDSSSNSQRISLYAAFKGITSEAAKQWGEYDRKGWLIEGHQADIVVLSTNPLDRRVPTKDVKVEFTFKNGEQVYPDL